MFASFTTDVYNNHGFLYRVLRIPILARSYIIVYYGSGIAQNQPLQPRKEEHIGFKWGSYFDLSPYHYDTVGTQLFSGQKIISLCLNEWSHL